MTRALFLAYYFPPIGGAGSQRSLKLARYLPDSGVEVTVVTGPGSAEGRWSPRDETLVAELPARTELRRIAVPEPRPSTGWRRRAEHWLRLGDPWSRWWVGETVTVGGADGRGPDVIVASMSPYSSAKAAVRLARATGAAWVADLRDPWALDEMTIYPTLLHRRLELRRMRRMLRSSSAIVTTTPEAVRLIRLRFPELASRPVVSIPNGFDASDFDRPPAARSDHAFRIVHTGYLHTDIGQRQRQTTIIRALLGGGMSGVEIMTRSHVYLLEAIERLIESDQAVAGKLELHLAGVLSESDARLAERLPFVRLHGYLNHADAIQLMQSADLLFLPMQKMPPGTRSSIVPGKTYEYLAARRPILAAVPEGDARDILAESGVARICEPDDAVSLAAAIAGEMERTERETPAPAASEEFIQRFERQVLARRYAELLNGLAKP